MRTVTAATHRTMRLTVLVLDCRLGSEYASPSVEIKSRTCPLIISETHPLASLESEKRRLRGTSSSTLPGNAPVAGPWAHVQHFNGVMECRGGEKQNLLLPGMVGHRSRKSEGPDNFSNRRERRDHRERALAWFGVIKASGS